MEDPIVLRNKLIENIRNQSYSSNQIDPAKAAAGIEKINAEFYELKDRLNEYTQLPKFTSAQFDYMIDVIDYMVAYNYRINIFPDILEVMEKFKITRLQKEQLLGIALRCAISDGDKEKEKKYFEIIPKEPAKGGRGYSHSLWYNLFLYHYKKGDREKALYFATEVVKQKILINVDTYSTHFLRNFTDKEKNEIEKIIEDLQKKYGT
jgi:hypothetical protein